MMRSIRLWSCLAAAGAGMLFSSGCSGLLRQSVINGVYTYVSGGISDSLSSSSGALQDFFTSLLFPGAASGTDTTST